MRSVYRCFAASVITMGVLATAGCRDRQERSDEGRMENTPGTVNEDLPADQPRSATNQDRPASVQAASVKNSESAALIRSVHQSEIDEANAVMGKLQSEPAKKLARMMLEKHTEAQRKLDGIMKSGSITAQDNEKVRDLKEDAQDNLRELNETAAKDLDMKYIDLQIEEHEYVLEMLDDKLIEETNDPGLSKFLRDQRGEIASHLEQAKQAKEDLKAQR